MWSLHCGRLIPPLVSAPNSGVAMPSESLALPFWLQLYFYFFLPCILSSRCVLGNTTILAEFATDEEVSRFLAQAQPPTPAATPSAPTAGWQSLETGQNQTDPVGPALNLFGGSTGLGQWSSGGGGGSSGGDLTGASLWGPPNYSSSLWGVPSVEDSHRMGSPAPLLPGDLLGGGSDSI